MYDLPHPPAALRMTTFIHENIITVCLCSFISITQVRHAYNPCSHVVLVRLVYMNEKIAIGSTSRTRSQTCVHATLLEKFTVVQAA